MRTVGFPISLKKNEKRRALVPSDIVEIKYKSHLYFEKGYGEIFGVSDSELKRLGVNIVDRDVVLQQDVICDPKAGDADYLSQLSPGKIVFGWIHAVQNRDITDKLVDNKLTAIAWEEMYEEGRQVFWKNNVIAGEAAVLHAFSFYGKMPYETKVAILGKGNTGRGAFSVLNGLGADVTVYDRKTEQLFRKELSKYDVIVNCILWDTDRNDHIIYRSDLKRMKKGSLIIDVSCDEGKGIETSKPTTIDEPVYFIDNVMHYAVDHTPSIFYKTASKSISEVIKKYLPFIIEGKEHSNKTLSKSIIIKNGEIIDRKIIDFQKRDMN